jgi:signal peptidase I
MSEAQAPPPPIAVAKRPRRWPIVVVALLAPIMAVFVGVGIILQVKGWRAFNAAGESMQPTVWLDELFFVDTGAYSAGRLPRRGDIVAFYSVQEWNGRRVEFIKRVIGLPGDQIAFKGGVPIINGVAATQERIGDYREHWRRGVRSRERLPHGTTYEIARTEKDSRRDNLGPYTVPVGAYYVVGDNRDNSLDSREAIPGTRQTGPWSVPLSDIIGRANYVYWSGFDRLDRIGLALK